MLKLITLFAINSLVYSTGSQYTDSHEIPYINAPTSITLIKGTYTNHVKMSPRNQITCEDLSHCPSKIHCYRNQNDILQKSTSWSCDVLGIKNAKYDYIIRWEGSHTPGHFTKESFYAYIKSPIIIKPPTFMETMLCMLILFSIFHLFSTIISNLNLDFISVILGIIGTLLLMNDSNNDSNFEWSHNDSVSSEID